MRSTTATSFSFLILLTSMASSLPREAFAAGSPRAVVAPVVCGGEELIVLERRTLSTPRGRRGGHGALQRAHRGQPHRGRWRGRAGERAGNGARRGLHGPGG